jgi:serine acetyltransferase
VPCGCVIGIGAIVTRKFDKENCAIAGVPAKIIKENVFWRKNV